MKRCVLCVTGKDGLAKFHGGEIDISDFDESQTPIPRDKGTSRPLHHPRDGLFVIVHVTVGVVVFSVSNPFSGQPDISVRVGPEEEFEYIIFDDQKPSTPNDRAGHRSEVPTDQPGTGAVQTATEIPRGKRGEKVFAIFAPHWE